MTKTEWQKKVEEAAVKNAGYKDKSDASSCNEWNTAHGSFKTGSSWTVAQPEMGELMRLAVGGTEYGGVFWREKIISILDAMGVPKGDE